MNYSTSAANAGQARRPHIVVLGAGFGGLNASRALRRVNADVTLLDNQPLLYQVSTGYLPPEEVGAALRAVFRWQSKLTVQVWSR